VAALNATRPEARAKVMEDIVLDDQYAMLRLKVVKRATGREEERRKEMLQLSTSWSGNRDSEENAMLSRSWLLNHGDRLGTD